jgi:outer membrane protein TolC
MPGTGVLGGALLMAALLAGGCAGPLHRGDEGELRRSLLASIDRELIESRRASAPVAPVRAEFEPLGLATEILEQLDRDSGPESYLAGPVTISPSLLGEAHRVERVSLQRAVLVSTSNSLSLQFARLVPAVSESQRVAAEGAFDWTLFGTGSLTGTDRQLQRTSPFGQQVQQQSGQSVSAGLRRQLVTGGQLTGQMELNRSDDDSPNITPLPNPANQLTGTLQLDQPLMRGFGSDAALAEVRLAGNAERDSIQQLKATVIQQVTQTEVAYWQLARAHGELAIARRLLDRGEEVRDTLRRRQRSAMDVRASQFSDAVATVEARRAEVIRAENNLRAASDQLKQLVNDPGLSVGSEVLLVPADRPVTEALSFGLRDTLATTLAKRPEVQRALLAINDAAIRQQLADNARLPQLDARLQVQLSELRDNADVALNELTRANFVNYLAGLSFEQPIGNRTGEAAYRGRVLESQQARITYRDVVQRVLLDVKGQLRGVASGYALIAQARASRLAAAENLRTLEVEEQTIQNLTPEFLDLKLRRQQALASAEAQELGALTEYNAAIARLHGAMGTALERNRIKFEVSEEGEGGGR